MPTDLTLGSLDWSYIQSFFYDFGLINKQVFFAVLFLSFFLLGFNFAIKKFLKSVHAHSNHVVHKPISTKFFFLLFYTFTLLHLITIEPLYYTGTIKGDPQGLAGSVLGYFVRLMPICFGVVDDLCRLYCSAKHSGLQVHHTGERGRRQMCGVVS